MRATLLAIFAAVGLAGSAGAATWEPKGFLFQAYAAGNLGARSHVFTFQQTGPADPITNTLAFGFDLLGDGIDPYGNWRLSRASWDGVFDVTVLSAKDARITGSASYEGTLPGAESDLITFFYDRTWVCVGRCELSVRDFVTGELSASGNILSSGKYSLAAVPLPASLPMLGAGLIFLRLAVKRRKRHIVA